MGNNLYVGNLPFSIEDDQLHELFAEYGTVTKAQVVKDRDTGRPRGFGFVEMSSDAEAQEAIEKLDGAQVDGRTLTVNEARPREDRGPRSGGGGRRHNSHRHAY